LLVFEILNCVVEFAFGQLIETDAHRSDPRLRLVEHVIGGAAAQATGVQRLVSTLSLLSPDLGVLLGRQALKALQQPLREARPRLGI
jgi:hypothetical protein